MSPEEWERGGTKNVGGVMGQKMMFAYFQRSQ